MEDLARRLPRAPRYVAEVVLGALLYWAVAKLGLSLPTLTGGVAPIWPPAGLALALVIVRGPRILPAIAVGELVANATSGTPLAAATGMAIGNTVEALAGLLLLRWVVGRSLVLHRVRDVIALSTLGAAVATTLSATAGVLSLWTTGVIPASALRSSWEVWWVGDALGVLIITPLLLSWVRPNPRLRSESAPLETAAALAMLAVATYAAFGGGSSYPSLVFPALAWMAMRLDRRMASTGALVVAVVAVVRTAHGAGAFADTDAVHALWHLDTFLAVVALTGMILGAVRSERDRVQLELRDTNATLDEQFRARTEELDRQRSAFSEAQRLAHVGTFEWDVVNDRLTWSDELRAVYGVTDSTLAATSETFFSRIHPDDAAHVHAEVSRAMSEGGAFRLEERIVRPDGEVRRLSSSGHVEHDDHGTPVRVVGVCRDVTEAAAAAEALVHQALHDGLTGLPNRTLFLDRLQNALTRQHRHGGTVAVLFLDLDRFKWVNDSLGHQAGDQLLHVVTRRLTECLRPEDTVARFGGDEFVLLCEDVDESDACGLATRIAAAVAQPVNLSGQEVTPHTSIGIALSSTGRVAGAVTPESLLRDADIAMYRAKEAGGDQWEIFDTALSTGIRVRLETETDLRRALERDELLLHYQPTIDLRSGTVIGVEALVRWAHPERGLLPPGLFVPVAEETGLIVPLGSTVMAMACREVGAWQLDEPALRDIVVGVNLSTRQLLDRGLIELVQEQLDVSGLEPSRLCIEITESVVLGDVERAAAALRALKDLGVTIGLDDFGTGYSSLSYLQRLPIDVLKIDRSFVAGLGSSDAGGDGADHALVASIIEMSHALDIRTIAEGIETEQQLRVLTRLGCDHAQGFYWSRPLPPDHARRWVEAALGRSVLTAAVSEGVWLA